MTVEQIEKAYQEGVNSPTVAGKEESFNKSLQLMQQLGWDSGELYYDMGNAYYQLEQYPWALFYYLKANKAAPRDQTVRQNISETLQKLELPNETYASWIPLSISEELLIAQLLILLTTLFVSWRIWFKDYVAKLLMKVFLILTVIFLVIIGMQHYMTPIEGVLANAAILYKHPDVQSERVFLDPLPPGTILQIIGATEQGDWTKIVNENGVVGYVQSGKVLM